MLEVRDKADFNDKSQAEIRIPGKFPTVIEASRGLSGAQLPLSDF